MPDVLKRVLLPGRTRQDGSGERKAKEAAREIEEKAQNPPVKPVPSAGGDGDCEFVWGDI
ncbi:hypothetical protein [Candidatus Manganitrophus noduliformans]|uniref:Uncharacterized protein n=1 Tax=Candidatus Manganitrophus noduliformans TaxID=2606439 RepID=A0A7X6I9G0_9BACT|nr:hypothetical protein [Candidatus Manganitrophus noduliformans]NKE69626.1 hypothetical protein [Candidatus Manganitrophus noduliformans]